MKSVIAFGVALGAAVLVGQSVETQLLQKNALSLEAPCKMVRAVEAEAERNYWHGAAAVVDDGGWLILLERINHAATTASVELTTLFRITSRCT